MHARAAVYIYIYISSRRSTHSHHHHITYKCSIIACVRYAAARWKCLRVVITSRNVCGYDEWIDIYIYIYTHREAADSIDNSVAHASEITRACLRLRDVCDVRTIYIGDISSTPPQLWIAARDQPKTNNTHTHSFFLLWKRLVCLCVRVKTVLLLQTRARYAIIICVFFADKRYLYILKNHKGAATEILTNRPHCRTSSMSSRYVYIWTNIYDKHTLNTHIRGCFTHAARRGWLSLSH